MFQQIGGRGVFLRRWHWQQQWGRRQGGLKYPRNHIECLDPSSLLAHCPGISRFPERKTHCMVGFSNPVVKLNKSTAEQKKLHIKPFLTFPQTTLQSENLSFRLGKSNWQKENFEKESAIVLQLSPFFWWERLRKAWKTKVEQRQAYQVVFEHGEASFVGKEILWNGKEQKENFTLHLLSFSGTGVCCNERCCHILPQLQHSSHQQKTYEMLLRQKEFLVVQMCHCKWQFSVHSSISLLTRTGNTENQHLRSLILQSLNTIVSRFVVFPILGSCLLGEAGR